MNKGDLRSLKYDDLLSLVLSCKEKSFRADQIFDWLHRKLSATYDEMSNVPGSLKDKLEERYDILKVEKERVLISGIDGTRKYIFRLYDDNLIESVFMRYEHGNSVCISSQVGCRMGCSFCASTLDGLVRNLLAGEMLGQIYEITKDVGERISNVVIMGSGEPLDNLDNVLDLLDIVNDKRGLNISLRNITLSTCGLTHKIRELADKKLEITLAISLHASDDDKRKKIMPVANSYSIAEIMDACGYYFDRTGRRISFEYALISGVNDGDDDACELAGLLKGLNCHVNLIPVNPINERDYKRSTKEAVRAFKNKLEKNNINVTIRREMGSDIDGACGQLRRRVMSC